MNVEKMTNEDREVYLQMLAAGTALSPLPDGSRFFLLINDGQRCHFTSTISDGDLPSLLRSVADQMESREGRKYAVIESMSAYILRNFKVRIWRDQIEVKSDYYKENQDISDFIHNSIPIPCCDAGDIAKRIADFPRVNAVEVTDVCTGHGVLIYPEWP